jgi:methylated-DNA-[protein]-cysteine S-methyltransferase
MTEHGFALFDTDIGPCGIAWGARGITGVQLPEASEARTRARLVRRYPHAREAPPPADVRRVIDGIVALLRGQASDLSAAALDMDGLPEFDRRVYAVARDIAPGATLSYGANAPWRATSGKRSGETRSRSSCRAIACSRPAARPAASPPTAA